MLRVYKLPADIRRLVMANASVMKTNTALMFSIGRELSAVDHLLYCTSQTDLLFVCGVNLLTSEMSSL